VVSYVHPLQGEELVEQSRIGNTLSEHLVGSEEAKWSESILYRDNYKVVAVRLEKVCKVLSAVAGPVPSSVNPHQDRQVGRVRWALHVQKEAVFGDIAAVFRTGARTSPDLVAPGTITFSLNGLMAIHRGSLGSLPAQFSSWWCRKSDAIDGLAKWEVSS